MSAVLVVFPEAHYLLPYLRQATCHVLIISWLAAHHDCALHWGTGTLHCCHAQPVVAACDIV